jgi:hypothetical protein
MVNLFELLILGVWALYIVFKKKDVSGSLSVLFLLERWMGS